MTPSHRISVRCRYPNGNCVLKDIDPGMSIESFQLLLQEKTDIEPEMQVIKTGYPPRTVQLPENCSESELANLVINGDIVMVEKKRIEQIVVSNPLRELDADTLRSTSSSTHKSGTFPRFPSVSENSAFMNTSNVETDGLLGSRVNSDTQDEDLKQAIALSLKENSPPVKTNNGFQPAPVWRERLEDGSYLVRRYVDSDNSCLFTAVAYVMEGNRLKGLDLRGVIAATVRSDPFQYNEAVLGQPNASYCEWIMNPQHWGGEIELLILSQYYKRQIAAYEIQSTNCYIYGNEFNFSERVLLVYDGIHYDALALSPYEDAPESLDVTVFELNSTTADGAIEAATSLVHQFKETNQFTDLSQFQLRCEECGRGFVGEPQAMDHGRATGHANFTEYR